MYIRTQLVKTAAVATLFVLGTAVLRAQTTTAVSRPVSAAALPVLGMASTSLKTPKKKQAVSEWNRSVNNSGPRFGVTYLPQAVVDSLEAHNITVGTMISQFGWQLEREIHVNGDGPIVLNEWVFLAGGLEKGVFLPSATWMVGARSRSGNEIAFGPNVSLAGVGLAMAAGVTVHSGGLNFPMNVAAASSRGGVRLSFLTGFTLH